jgi:hypothetical protein
MIDFSSLYQAYARDVHRFATLLSGDAALAREVEAARAGALGLPPKDRRPGSAVRHYHVAMLSRTAR